MTSTNITDAAADSASRLAAEVTAADGTFPTDIPLLRSCENCRRKKRKCSGHKPACTRCKAQNETCVYRPTARYFKPRSGAGGLGAAAGTAARKQASVPDGGSAHRHGVSKSRSEASSGARPRAMSVVPALKKMQVSGSSALHQSSLSLPVTSLAPADLILNSSRNPVSPRSASEGDKPQQQQDRQLANPLANSGGVAAALGAQQQQQVIGGMPSVDLVGFVTDGLAYMSTGSVDDASAASHLSSPELPMNPEFSFTNPAGVVLGSQPTSVAPAPTSRVSAARATSHQHSLQQQQLQYQHNIAAAAAAAAAVAAASSNNGSPPSSAFVSDYTQLLASQISAQQTAAAAAALMAAATTAADSSVATSEMLGLAVGLAAASCTPSADLLVASSPPEHMVAPLIYTPPLGSASLSSGTSSTPSLTECTPSPYSAPYPLCVPSHQAIAPSLPSSAAGNGLFPQQALLAQPAAVTQSYPAMALMVPRASTGIDSVLPQNPSAFSEWFV